MRKFFSAAAFVCFCVYAGASLFAPADRPALAVVPLLAALGCTVLAAADRWWPLALVPVAGAVIAVSAWSPAWLMYAPPTLMNLLVAAIFLGSLRPGREPIVSRFARIAHGGVLDPCFVGYTRKVTIAWGVFLLASAVLSVIFAAFTPRSWWWMFCNVIIYVGFFIGFVGEYAIRKRVFPDFDHVSPLRLFGVVRQHGVGAGVAARRTE